MYVQPVQDEFELARLLGRVNLNVISFMIYCSRAMVVM